MEGLGVYGRNVWFCLVIWCVEGVDVVADGGREGWFAAVCGELG
jgi:hypothetical protein